MSYQPSLYAALEMDPTEWAAGDPPGLADFEDGGERRADRRLQEYLADPAGDDQEGGDAIERPRA